MRPRPLCRSARQRGLTGLFPCGGTCVGVFGEGRFSSLEGPQHRFFRRAFCLHGAFPFGEGARLLPRLSGLRGFSHRLPAFPVSAPVFHVSLIAGQGGFFQPSTVSAERGDFSVLRETVCGCLREFFSLRGRMCGPFRAEGLFPHYPGAWFSLSRPFLPEPCGQQRRFRLRPCAIQRRNIRVIPPMRRAGRFRGVFSRVRPASAPFSSYGPPLRRSRAEKKPSQ